jgi:hypothetical protein
VDKPARNDRNVCTVTKKKEEGIVEAGNEENDTMDSVVDTPVEKEQHDSRVRPYRKAKICRSNESWAS